MEEVLKQTAIYIPLILTRAPSMMIATFYPNIAISKGIPYWLIGLIFSIEPASGLIESLILGKCMIKIGRRATIIMSLISVSISTTILAPIEYCDVEIFLLLSFASRTFAGIGSTSATVAADSICISDYPESIEQMIGRIEIAIGSGISIGPLLGALMYLWILVYSLLAYTIFVLICCPIVWISLSNLRDYKNDNIKISYKKLMFKPVFFI